MTDHLENYLADPVPEPDGNYRDLQRVALQEVIKLSVESVRPAESQVETAFQTTDQNTKLQFEQARKQVKTSSRGAKNSIEQSHQQQLTAIQSKYEKKLKGLEEQTQRQRDTLASDTESEFQKATQQRDYDLLLSETEFNAQQKNIARERNDIQVAIPAARARLEALREEADWWMRRYRQSAVEWEAPVEGETRPLGDLIDSFREKNNKIQSQLSQLQQLRTPKIFVGLKPLFYTFMACALAVVCVWLIDRQQLAQLPAFHISAPVAILIALILVFTVGRVLWIKATRQVQAIFKVIVEIIVTGLAELKEHLKQTLEQCDRDEKTAQENYEQEAVRVKEQYASQKCEIARRFDRGIAELEQSHRNEENHLMQCRIEEFKAVEGRYYQGNQKSQLEQKLALEKLRQGYHEKNEDYQSLYALSRQRLKSRWQNGLKQIGSLLGETELLDEKIRADWDHALWQLWSPDNHFSPLVRFGQAPLLLSRLAESVRQLANFKTDPETPIMLPATLGFPNHCSLFLQTQRAGYDEAIGVLRSVMVRLMTSQPPGRVRFTILDPVGLGESFAGFMHVADYVEALVGGRIWTSSEQIQQQLLDLTDHMENVIQKHLRNEFDTIEAYNRQAGELAEPYRFLVIADFPTHFNEESLQRLSSIVKSGPRCGVYTLIAYDDRQGLPPGFDLEDFSSNSVHLLCENGKFVWQDPVYRQFPLLLDAPPSEELLTKIMRKAGAAARNAVRVEVPFDSIAPEPDSLWSLDSSEELDVPVGRTGATRLQHLKLGKGMAQHLLMAGKTGSGKSTLMHVIITNLTLWYSPLEVELYLIDFKKGVEFKTYVKRKLPHIRAVAIESDRQFGLSILQRLDAEMTRRGDLYRQVGAQDLAGYRQITGETLPRTVLVVDEFQVFFADDDKLSQDVALLLEQLVRQGRAFGIHVILGSQTLAGTSTLARSTTGQMAVRIALQCSEADSQLILDDENLAARLLSRPGEAIYNDAGGMVVGNSPFQTAWLSDSDRDAHLEKIVSLADKEQTKFDPPIVFEGNVPANIAYNHQLESCLAAAPQSGLIAAPMAWLGEPVAIKDPTAVCFRRQSGVNLLITGQNDQASLGVTTSALISLAAQHERNAARFVILDGTPADSPYAGKLEAVATSLPHEAKLVGGRQVGEIMEELSVETQRRYQQDVLDAPCIYLIIYGLQRYRDLRRNEDDFGFSMEAESKPQPDKQLVEILREGPSVGVHTLVWADTLTAVERALDRQALREFDNRVLFQMSSADSSNLIDSPAANRLGYHRALFYSEEQGIIEKFRPYAPADSAWLREHLKSY
jgi:ABC-type multidrug transport system fused ATPase/permease subunit